MLQNINRRHAEMRKHDPQLEARIQAFELAFRMQIRGAGSVSGREGVRGDQEALWSRRSDHARFRWQCLLARRLAERDVRFIQCTHSYKWDQHSELFNLHTENAA